MKTQRQTLHAQTRIRHSCKPGFLRVENDLFRCVFEKKQGGFPSRLGFAEEQDDIICAKTPFLTAVLDEKKRQVFPVWDGSRPDIYYDDTRLRVVFNDLRWKDDHGGPFSEGRLSLQYEFNEDGVVFVTTFFYTDTTTPARLRDVALQIDVSLTRDQEANWSYWRLPSEVTGKLIQDLSHFERNLGQGTNRRWNNTILPFVSFDFGTSGCRDRHLEFFVESWNSFTTDHRNTATSIKWQGQNAAIEWNFQKEPAVMPTRCLQWRNVWGWCLRRFPSQRRRMPWRIFHYLDSAERYPSETVIRQMADEGGTVLILHECWRKDLQNSEFPADTDRLKKTILACRKYGLRLVLYVRGNEDVIREKACRDLRPYLSRDRDGIYMDYGSPICYMKVDENAPGGRIPFQEYYASHKTVRDFVGEDGIFISHTGSFFSAIGHTSVDAYLGGEQEKGELLKNSTVHAYFSGLSVAPPSLWTAAFPTYRTKKAIPFLASTFQAPFVHLGNQIPCSSLVHPALPSAITFARPLWRLWELFDEKKNVTIQCTQSAQDAFRTDSSATGVSVAFDRSGDVLLIVSNFSDAARKVAVNVNWKKLSVRPGRECFTLTSGYEINSYERSDAEERFEAVVEGNGLKGWLMVKNGRAWVKQLKRFTRPYPVETVEAEKYRSAVAEIRQQRFQPPAWKNHFLRVSIPNWLCTWENSIWYDLYENTIELHDWSVPEKKRFLGYVGKNGLVKKKPSREELLWPGDNTPWIPIDGMMNGAGRTAECLFALATRKGDNEFYSFIKGELSPIPRMSSLMYEINFCNEIDFDWSVLTFTLKQRT